MNESGTSSATQTTNLCFVLCRGRGCGECTEIIKLKADTRSSGLASDYKSAEDVRVDMSRVNLHFIDDVFAGKSKSTNYACC